MIDEDTDINRVLVVRNDKLGDFMLAWPALALIKDHLADNELHVLVPEYTREIAGLCPSVDRVIVDPEELLLIDLNRANNSFVANPTRRADLRWGLKLLFLIQNLLQTLGGLVT